MTVHHNIGTDAAPVIACSPRIKRGKHVRELRGVTCTGCLCKANRNQALAKHGRITDTPHQCHCGEVATRHDGAELSRRKYGCARHAPVPVYLAPEELIAWRRR